MCCEHREEIPLGCKLSYNFWLQYAFPRATWEREKSPSAHATSFFHTQGHAGAALFKAAAHGVSRALIAKAQGQKMSSAFWSGFASSAFSVGNRGYGNITGRTLIMATVGGTVSQLTGGKFANGAVTGAFVHLFNTEMTTYPSKENLIKDFTKNISRAYRALSMMVRSQGMGMRGLQPLSYSQAYDRVLNIESMNDTIGIVLIGGASLLTGEAALMAVGRFGMVTANGYEATLFTRGITSPIPTLTTPNSWHEITGFVIRQVSGI